MRPSKLHNYLGEGLGLEHSSPSPGLVWGPFSAANSSGIWQKQTGWVNNPGV